MGVALSTIRSAAAASWMRPFQLATLLVLYAVVRPCAVQRCQRPNKKLQQRIKLMQQRKRNEALDRADATGQRSRMNCSVVGFVNSSFCSSCRFHSYYHVRMAVSSARVVTTAHENMEPSLFRCCIRSFLVSGWCEE